jgi:hypothetical protein
MLIESKTGWNEVEQFIKDNDQKVVEVFDSWLHMTLDNLDDQIANGQIPTLQDVEFVTSEWSFKSYMINWYDELENRSELIEFVKSAGKSVAN